MTFFYIALGVAGGVLAVLAFIWLNNSWLKTTRRKIAVAGLERDLKIVHLSDLHGKLFGKSNKRLIKKIVAQSPDFIAVTGDIIHLYTQKNIEVALELVENISKIAPVIYVSGNHEMRNKGYAQFRERLAAAGARVLDDCTEQVCGLSVTGLNCASLKNDKIFKITPPGGYPKLLLAHRPEYAEKYAEAGYDVVLCGHAHGGQWRIPFTGIGVYSPGQGVFPALTSGVHTCGKTRIVISRGLGNSQCPLRLFNRPEMVVVNLTGINVN